MLAVVCDVKHCVACEYFMEQSQVHLISHQSQEVEKARRLKLKKPDD